MNANVRTDIILNDNSSIGVPRSLGRNAMRLINGPGSRSVAVATFLIRGDRRHLDSVVGPTFVVRNGKSADRLNHNPTSICSLVTQNLGHGPLAL